MSRPRVGSRTKGPEPVRLMSAMEWVPALSWMRKASQRRGEARGDSWSDIQAVCRG
jgi:hypothetical protein